MERDDPVRIGRVAAALTVAMGLAPTVSGLVGRTPNYIRQHARAYSLDMIELLQRTALGQEEFPYLVTKIEYVEKPVGKPDADGVRKTRKVPQRVQAVEYHPAGPQARVNAAKAILAVAVPHQLGLDTGDQALRGAIILPGPTSDPADMQVIRQLAAGEIDLTNVVTPGEELEIEVSDIDPSGLAPEDHPPDPLPDDALPPAKRLVEELRAKRRGER